MAYALLRCVEEETGFLPERTRSEVSGGVDEGRNHEDPEQAHTHTYIRTRTHTHADTRTHIYIYILYIYIFIRTHAHTLTSTDIPRE